MLLLLLGLGVRHSLLLVSPRYKDPWGVVRDGGVVVDGGGCNPISALMLDKNIDVRLVPGGVMLVIRRVEVGVPRGGPGVTGDSPECGLMVLATPVEATEEVERGGNPRHCEEEATAPTVLFPSHLVVVGDDFLF